MPLSLTMQQARELWLGALRDSVRREGPDLSARQMTILLIVSIAAPPHTVRGLAAALNVSKPAISRALDSLGKLGLARRSRDPADRRSVHIHVTAKGSAYLDEFAKLIVKAGAGLPR